MASFSLAFRGRRGYPQLNRRRRLALQTFRHPLLRITNSHSRNLERAPQLMELAEAEPLRVLNHHHRGVRHVYPYLATSSGSGSMDCPR